ncbi:hypothetical protein [Flavobacterium sp. WC2509]|uniref:hypothetical protein n=1 Tax=Flavobacterium sp. WC2509 TaxID=3461406 RepID=UPI004044F3E3
MSKGKNNTATVSVAVLKSNFEASELALNAITETATAEEKEAAQTAFDEAKKVLDALNDVSTDKEGEDAQIAFEESAKALEVITALPTPEEKALAQTAYDEAKKAYETATAPKASTVPKAEKEKYLKGVFVVSPTGKYNLAYNVGESASLPELQALELEEAGYFKLDK